MAIQYFTGDSRYYIDYTVTPVGTPDIANNRSQVRRLLRMVRASGSGDVSSSAVSSWKSWGPTNIPAGSGRSYFAFNFSGYGGPLTLLDTTQWVTHNADGTFSLYSEADVFADLSTGSPDNRRAWVGFSTELPTIPRATSPNIGSATTFTTGSATTINLPRAASGFTHDVTWKLGTKSGTIATGAGVTTSFNPPHTVMTELPNAATGELEITVVTKNGATTVGTKTVKFPLTAGAAVVPTVSGVTWDDANTTVKTNIGGFVQGLSLVKGAVAAAGIHGSSIASKALVVGGQTFPENTAFLVNGSGTISATAQATDTRGRTGSAAASFSVLPYLPPQIGANGWQVRRANSSNVVDDNGQYLRIDLHAIASSLIVGTQKNALNIQVRTRPTNGAWTNRNTVNPGLTQNGAIQVTGGGIYLTTQSYEVEITITDNTSAPAIILKTVIGTTVVAIDIRDSRVGIGKMHELGQLDVAGDIYMNGVKVSVEGHVHSATNITSGTLAAARLPAATETAIGAVERATQAEVDTGTDTSRYVSPAGLRNRAVRPGEPFAMAAGRVNTGASVGNSVPVYWGNSITVTLPVSRFNVAPIVTGTAFTVASGGVGAGVDVNSTTTTSFVARIKSVSSHAANAFAINWIAIQMTSDSATG